MSLFSGFFVLSLSKSQNTTIALHFLLFATYNRANDIFAGKFLEQCRLENNVCLSVQSDSVSNNHPRHFKQFFLFIYS